MTTAIVGSTVGTSALWEVDGIDNPGRLSMDRALGHRFFMSRLPDAVLDPENPRKHAGLLWAVEANHTGVRLLMRSEVALELAGIGAELRFAEDLVQDGFTEGQELLLSVDVERTYVPFIAPPEGFVDKAMAPGLRRKTRTRREVIPTHDIEHLHLWAGAKLARIGVEPVSDGPVLRCFSAQVGVFGSGDSRSIPGVEVSSRVRVIDSVALSAGCAIGLGRSKNYGFGLLRLRK